MGASRQEGWDDGDGRIISVTTVQKAWPGCAEIIYLKSTKEEKQ